MHSFIRIMKQKDSGVNVLKHSKFNVENLLQEIRAEITCLNVAEDFRDVILEDIELAILYFKEKNIISLANCLAVLVAQLQTQVILSRCRGSLMAKLLPDIHRLQQILMKLPVSVGGPVDTAAAGATDPAIAAETAEMPEVAGPGGASGTTRPTITAGTTRVLTTSYPASRYPIQYPTTASQTSFFDDGTHIIINCHSRRRR